MNRDIEQARTAAVKTFLAVLHLARRARALEQAVPGKVPALTGLAKTLDVLAYQAEAAIRGHAGCLIAAELAMPEPALGEVAIALARAAESWAAILETVSKASVLVYAQARDVALATAIDGR